MQQAGWTLSQQYAWLDIVEKYIQENETESECDDDDVVPQVVDGVCGIESDEEDMSV